MPVSDLKVKVLVIQSCLTLCDLMNHSTPGLPVHHHKEWDTPRRLSAPHAHKSAILPLKDSRYITDET